MSVPMTAHPCWGQISPCCIQTVCHSWGKKRKHFCLDFRAFGEFAVMHFASLLRSQSQALLKQPLVARTLYQSVHYRSLIQQKHLVHRWSRWCPNLWSCGMCLACEDPATPYEESTSGEDEERSQIFNALLCEVASLKGLAFCRAPRKKHWPKKLPCKPPRSPLPDADHVSRVKWTCRSIGIALLFVILSIWVWGCITILKWTLIARHDATAGKLWRSCDCCRSWWTPPIFPVNT